LDWIIENRSSTPKKTCLPAEFKDVKIKTPYTSRRWVSRLMQALANQMAKTGIAIKNILVKSEKQETY